MVDWLAPTTELRAKKGQPPLLRHLIAAKGVDNAGAMPTRPADKASSKNAAADVQSVAPA
jgi:hypothetical protein